ncbi:hypothetical protein [uncultured Reyranella sp.]|uniref:hypothetical protein n=1 Tax=uncultured Reyranella sp. TaxID=735512 RepID=UPI0025E8D4AA|nr:hypothetical protein [uncultured Reyranella sp.]
MSPDPPQSSPPPRLILDILRPLYAATSQTPKGIPQVELAYAEHFRANKLTGCISRCSMPSVDPGS